MNEVNIAGLNAVEEAVRRETEAVEAAPKKFERRNTIELPIPDSAAEREAARQAHEARAAKVRETGSAEAWRRAHSRPSVAEPTVDQVLEQRNTIHGDFTEDATTAQALKYVMRKGRNWEDMPPWMKEALEQMQTKVARILAGDFTHLDHWKDLQGYPRLVETRLEK